MRMMSKLETEQERMVALLHDVLEDTAVTLAELEEAGFSVEVLQAVQTLTRRPGESRMEAAQRAAQDPLALSVKLDENAANQNPQRNAEPQEEDLQRMREYRKVRRFLLQARKQKAE